MSKKVVLVIALALAGLAGLMYYSIVGNLKYRVEVCVAFNGRTSCRTSRADTEAHAMHTAQSNACGLIASGVTDTMKCEQTPPTSVIWLTNK